jgi:two-component system, chemotaxis family, response regulator Rcp1
MEDPSIMSRHPVSTDPIEILLVEDNPGDVRLALETLKEVPILTHLNVVEDGVKALEFLRRRGLYVSAPRPNLILLDLDLPGLDGRELLRIMNADPDLAPIPVAVLTSSQSLDDPVRAYQFHVKSYISKPVDLRQLLDVLYAVQDFWFRVAQ